MSRLSKRARLKERRRQSLVRKQERRSTAARIRARREAPKAEAVVAADVVPPAPVIDPARRWHVLRIKVPSAVGACKRIEGIGVAIYCPHRASEFTDANGRRRSRKVPLLWKTVFAGVRDDEQMEAAAAIAGRRSLWRVEERPVVIPVNDLVDFSAMLDAPKPAPAVGLELGTRVRVMDGAFASFPGVVEAIDGERGRIKVSVSIFGRPTPVDLDLAQIARVD